MQKARKIDRPTKFDTENSTGKRNWNALGVCENDIKEDFLYCIISSQT
jgi:hypothetical protein